MQKMGATIAFIVARREPHNAGFALFTHCDLNIHGDYTR